MNNRKLPVYFSLAVMKTAGNLFMCLLLCTGIQQCGSGNTPPAQVVAQPVVTENGACIAIPEGADTSLFKTAEVRRGPVREEILAPARVALSSSRSENTPEYPLFLFDSPDNASLYSTFRQNTAAYELAKKTCDRTKDLYSHQSASGKDVESAESDLATATAALAETEGKLRALGLDPAIFRNAPSGKAWIIADVPEAQLHEVKKGERAAVTFSSYPGDTVSAAIEAIGEVIDGATRTIKVRLGIANPGSRYKPGMFVSVNFGQSRLNAIAISQDGLVTVQGRSYVFVLAGDRRYLRREVEPGEKFGDSAIVLRGLSDGEHMAVTGAMLLKGLSFGY
jgi:multidrug efflux pump subunit AcrA (membrane-fusion protein)